MVNAQRVFLKENSHFLQDRPHGPVFLFENPPMMHFQIRNRWYKKISPGPGGDTWSGHLVGTPGRDTLSGHLVGTPGRGTYDQHESLRLRRAVLQFTLPTSREHITLTHSHSRTYTPKDIIRTQKMKKNQHFISNSMFFILILMKIYRNFNNFPKIVKNIRDFINFNAFGGGVAKNGEIIFEKIRIFRLREYPRSSSAMPGGIRRQISKDSPRGLLELARFAAARCC